MLDYGASIRVYYPAERMRSDFEAHCDRNGIDPEHVVAMEAGRDDYEAFWQSVSHNLRVGNIRMLFVADHLPAGLRRVIEFLNEHLDSPEVLGVEIKQYAGQGQRAYVPRVIGQTQKARDRKPSRTRAVLREISSGDAIALIERGYWEPEDEPICRRIVDWASECGLTLRWWSVSPTGLFIALPGYGTRGRGQVLFSAKFHEGMCIEMLGSLVTSPPFDQEASRIELVHRFNAIDGIDISEDEIRAFPHCDMAIFRDSSKLESFLGVFEWVIGEFRETG